MDNCKSTLGIKAKNNHNTELLKKLNSIQNHLNVDIYKLVRWFFVGATILAGKTRFCCGRIAYIFYISFLAFIFGILVVVVFQNQTESRTQKNTDKSMTTTTETLATD